MAYSPNGERFAIGDSSGRVSLFDAATKQQMASWETSHEMVQSLSFAPSASLLATAGGDGTVCIWSSDDGTFQDRYALTNAGSSRADFIDDTHLVASNGTTTIFIIGIDSKAVIELPGELGEVYDVTSSKKTKTLAAIGEWGVGVWDLGSTERTHVIGTRDTPTTQSIRFSPTGHELAFRSGYQKVQVWSVGTRDDRVSQMRIVASRITSLSFSKYCSPNNR